MEPFIYFGKLILCSGVLFGYYLLALRNRTFHQYNRFYLLFSVVISLVLPLVRLSWFTLEPDNRIAILYQNFNFSSTKTSNYDSFGFGVPLIALGVVSLFFLIRFLAGIFKIFRLKKMFPKQEIDKVSFYETDLVEAPFSFFRNLFWKNSILINSDAGKQILKHEMVHIEQNHSLDKLFMEVAVAVFWFNPFFWFIRKEINLIHEYLADKKAVKHMDTKAFAQMLLAGRFSGTAIPATSPFLSSNLKKRLKMLQKPKTKFGYLHRILALPLVFAIAFAYAVSAKNKEITATNDYFKTNVKSDTIAPKLNSTSVLPKKDEAVFSKKEQKMMENERLQAIADHKQAMADAVNAAKEAAVAQEDAKTAAKDAAEAAKDAAEAADFVNSKEFKQHMANAKRAVEEGARAAAEAKAHINSPEFKKAMENAKIAAKKAQDYLNSDAYKKAIEDAKNAANKAQDYLNYDAYKKANADAKIAAKKAQDYLNSNAYKKAMQAAKTAEINAAQAHSDATNFLMISDGKVVHLGGKKNTSWNKVRDYEVYINDKLSDEAEWKKLDNQKIESVSISTLDDDKKTVMRIKTK